MFNTILNWSIAAILASFTIMPGSFIRQTAPAVEPAVEETKTVTDYYWFEIDGNYNPSSNIDPSDAHFVNIGSEPEDDLMCNGEEFLCIGGFTSGQVNDLGQGVVVLKPNQSATEKSRLKN